MLLFSARHRLGKIIEAWMRENSVLNCPVSTIGYLVGHGLLDEEKVREFLENDLKGENHGSSLQM